MSKKSLYPLVALVLVTAFISAYLFFSNDNSNVDSPVADKDMLTIDDEGFDFVGRYSGGYKAGELITDFSKEKWSSLNWESKYGTVEVSYPASLFDGEIAQTGSVSYGKIYRGFPYVWDGTCGMSSAYDTSFMDISVGIWLQENDYQELIHEDLIETEYLFGNIYAVRFYLSLEGCGGWQWYIPVTSDVALSFYIDDPWSRAYLSEEERGEITSNISRLPEIRQEDLIEGILRKGVRINGELLQDNTKVSNSVVKDSGGLEHLGGSFYKDSEHVYFKEQLRDQGEVSGIIKDADPKTFEMLDHEYARDKNNVFYNTWLVEGADSKSFESIGHGYGKDANHVYVGPDVIEGADPQTFEVFYMPYAKDKNFVYFNGKQMSKDEYRKIFGLSSTSPIISPVENAFRQLKANPRTYPSSALKDGTKLYLLHFHGYPPNDSYTVAVATDTGIVMQTNVAGYIDSKFVDINNDGIPEVQIDSDGGGNHPTCIQSFYRWNGNSFEGIHVGEYVGIECIDGGGLTDLNNDGVMEYIAYQWSPMYPELFSDYISSGLSMDKYPDDRIRLCKEEKIIYTYDGTNYIESSRTTEQKDVDGLSNANTCLN